MSTPIATIARKIAERIIALPKEVVSSFQSISPQHRVARIQSITNEIAIDIFPVITWIERNRPQAAELEKKRLAQMEDYAERCAASETPEYKGGVVTPLAAGDRTSDGAKLTAEFVVFCELFGRAILGWADEIEKGDLVAERPRVISLHGIRTRGEWQKWLTEVLNNHGFDHIPLDYGRFNLLQFLWAPSRRKKIVWLLGEYTRLMDRRVKPPSVIAHSMGTHLIAELLRTRPEVKFNRIIFCGSIVYRTFPWSQCRERDQFAEVLNDYGERDIPVRLAEYVIPTAGPSGSRGFLDDAQGSVVQRRNPEFKHSDFFSKLNFEKNWVPFLQGKRPQSAQIDAVPTNWKFLILCLTLLTLTIGLVLIAKKYWPVKADLAAPLLDSEFPVVKDEELPKLAQVEASVPSQERLSIVIENQTTKRLEVCAYNTYRHYFRSDISQPDWSQLKPIDPGTSEPLIVKNAKSGIFQFYVRDAYSPFVFLGRFDLTEVNDGGLAVTITNGTYVATPIAH